MQTPPTPLSVEEEIIDGALLSSGAKEEEK